VLVKSASEYVKVFGGHQPGHQLFLGVVQFFANGGRSAWVVRLATRNLAGIGRALAALDVGSQFNLLCLPGLSGPRTLSVAATDARSRQAIFVADPAGSRQATIAAVRSIRRADRGHVALYYPRLRVPDPLRPSATTLCGPAASVAGILARIDDSYGFWIGAAGSIAKLRGATEIATPISEHAACMLRRDGVNAILALPNRGFFLWGARTIGGDGAKGDEWRYLSVRRTAILIEQSVEKGLAWAASEPNDEPTWNRVLRAVEEFLEDVSQRGAFAGKTAAESYFVRCGADTTTQRDIERGIMVVEIGFAPLRPAEFVNLRIRLKRP
jgi:phage tail sheath protein FI